jgi:hypothetical protein
MTGPRNSAHVVPRDDAIDHDTNDECICIPRSDPVTRVDGSVGWVVVHHALDGREQTE